MVHTCCIVPGCKNTSNDPHCYSLSWHRLPSSEESLKQGLRIHTIRKADITKDSRICSQYMSNSVYHVRKPPKDRQYHSTGPIRYKPTRNELR
jgi:hypothetical protein